MSKADPIYGIDVSGHQRNFSMFAAANEGYSFCVVKATEGPYRDGSTFTNPLFKQQINSARAAGLVVGSYHFLVNTAPKAQVEHFLRTIDSEPQMIMVDFEAYPNYPNLSPTNEVLKGFISHLRDHIGEHPVIIYSGQGYWNSGTPSGDFEQYGADKSWDAYYPLGGTEGYGSVLYQRVLDKGWGERWGGKEPSFWQFSASGRVAGQLVDVNAFRGSFDNLLALTE